MTRIIRNRRTGETRTVEDSDLPNYGIGASSTMQPTSVDTSSNTGGLQSEDIKNLQQLLILKSLQDPKHISTYQTVGKLFEGLAPQTVELKGKPASDVALQRGVLRASQEASTKYKPEYTGLLDNIKQQAAALFNVGGKEAASFRGNIADIRTAVRQYISGAAIPASEAKEFEDLIPKASDSDTIVRQKLVDLQNRSMGKIGDVLATAGYEVTPEEYLKTKTVTPQEDSATLLQTLLGILPAAGSTAGAIGGGILGGAAGSVVPGAGTALGAVGGAGAGGAIGGGAGYALKDLLSELLGEQEQTKKKPGQKLLEAGGEAALGGIGGATGETLGLAGRGIARGVGGYINPVGKVAAKEAGVVAGKAGQTLDRNALVSLYETGVKQSKATGSQLTKLVGPEKSRILNDYFPTREIPFEDAAALLRSTFKSVKNPNSTAAYRNEALRYAIENLSPELKALSADYAKAYGRRKTVQEIGRTARGAGVGFGIGLGFNRLGGYLPGAQ